MPPRRKAAPKSTPEIAGHADPRAPLDSKRLLAAATPVLERLAADLLDRAKRSPAITSALEAQHRAEQSQRRTADPFLVWQASFVDQVAAAWLLSCVFVRTLEDRGLLAHARLAGPGAADSQRLFFEMAPSLGERDYLLAVFREMCRFPAARALFDAEHNPVWLLAPSSEAAQGLLGLFRSPEPEAPVFRFGQEDTRFLGDLYQDLNEAVQKRYALLQTPRFVESFILDRALERAIERFGLDEATLIDPTCGSGHFLLGAFERLYDHRLRTEPGLGQREAARKALDAVYGTDINPYAVAIARFRLTLAYVEKAGFKKIAEAPVLPLHVVVADSLLHNAQRAQVSFGEVEGQSAAAWGGKVFALEDERAARDVLYRRYAAVVGNPPYITVKDAVLRERYREMYSSAFRSYSLGVPFTERFFQLAREGGSVGMITANSFMKREFGKKLIEEYLPSVNLDLIVNTSGAYIPGHGTPTVLLFGTMEAALGNDVLAVLAKRGEPTTPDPAENGLVWRSIEDHWQEVGFENEFVSVARVERGALKKHPWSLGGGGAAELKELLEERGAQVLEKVAEAIGFSVITGEDNVLLAPDSILARSGLPPEHRRRLAVGEELRDWSIADGEYCVWTSNRTGDRLPESALPDVLRHLWPYRRTLRDRKAFGVDVERKGIPWWALREVYSARMKTQFTIAFPFVATHNHFVLDRGGCVFGRTAPIIKLPETATEDDHLALLAYLNSSTACFWMKQVSHNKGSGTDKGGWQDEPAKARFEFAGTQLAQIPIPSLQDATKARLRNLASEADHLGAQRARLLDSFSSTGRIPESAAEIAALLDRSGAMEQEIEERMIATQEEIDWTCYAAFGLCGPEVLRSSSPGEVPLPLGARPFEVLAGREGKQVGIDGQSLRTSTINEIDEVRVREISRNTDIAMIEVPLYKRRWRSTPKELGGAIQTFRHRAEAALRGWQADVLEQAVISVTGEGSSVTPTTANSLGRHVPTAFSAVADHLEPTAGARGVLRRILGDESIPYLPQLRFTELGMAKRKAWEETWENQRTEDREGRTLDMKPPDKYASSDYQTARFWEIRGKLDVPKERFISYPGCESDEDGEPVYGWAGWNHLQQAQALAALYQKRKTEEAWQKDRLTPMLAGLLELLPWIRQWHNEPSDDYAGMRLGDFFEGFLEGELRAHSLTRDDLRSHRPTPKKRPRATPKPKPPPPSPDDPADDLPAPRARIGT